MTNGGYMNIKIGFLALVSTLYVGCQALPYVPYARDVKRKPQQGGIIALKAEHRDEDRAKAERMMSTNCNNQNVKIIEEGEVSIGQTTTGSAQQSSQKGSEGSQVGMLFGVPVVAGQQDPTKTTASSSTTTNLTEWQINYECQSKKR
jgi:hypothetical protein